MNFFKKIFKSEESEKPLIDDKTSIKACIALLLETSMADEVLEESELSEFESHQFQSAMAAVLDPVDAAEAETAGDPQEALRNRIIQWAHAQRGIFNNELEQDIVEAAGALAELSELSERPQTLRALWGLWERGVGIGMRDVGFVLPVVGFGRIQRKSLGFQREGRNRGHFLFFCGFRFDGV